MEDTELFGELHKQEENGLYGRKHAELCFLQNVRESALTWFNKLGLEQQFYKTIECNHLITGDRTRHPSTLTGSEIEKIYKHVRSL